MGALNAAAAGGWARRARPLLGTLVEVGLPPAAPAGGATHEAAFAAVWALLQDLQAQLSIFDPGSDLSGLHAAPPGTRLRVRPHTARVLKAACHWATLSDGAFDLAQGSGPWHWDGAWLWREHARTWLDAGGLAKGDAIDQAVAQLQAQGWPAGWVNAGGDLRVFGPLRLPLVLRDEAQGGTRAWGWLEEGAAATSHFGPGARSRLHSHAGGAPIHTHLSVLAPTALAADALTKVLAQQPELPAAWLAGLGAHAVFHAATAPQPLAEAAP